MGLADNDHANWRGERAQEDWSIAEREKPAFIRIEALGDLRRHRIGAARRSQAS